MLGVAEGGQDLQQLVETQESGSLRVGRAEAEAPEAVGSCVSTEPGTASAPAWGFPLPLASGFSGVQVQALKRGG